MQAWSKISRMPAGTIQKLQDELLQKVVQELSEKHPYYRELFKEKGIDPASIRGRNDMPKLPFTTKEDMAPRQDDPFHPKKFVMEPPAADEGKNKKGGFKLFGKKEVGPDPTDYKLATLYYTAGRTAKPLPVVYTRGDLNNLIEAGIRAFDIWEMTRDDTMINSFSYAPNVSFWQMYYSTMEIGSTALQAGGGRVLGMEKILRALHSTEAPVLAAHPGYAQAALQTLDHFGFKLPALERVLVGMDYTPMAQVERIKELMKEVGAQSERVQRIYFVSEAKSGWAECEPGHGYHLNPDHVFVEIVDPETGEPLSEGQGGEVVITNLNARGTVVLRFRTGDIATGGLTTEPCPNCGRTVPRLLGEIERKSLCFDLKGGTKFDGNSLRSYLTSDNRLVLWYAELVSTEQGEGLKIIAKEGNDVESTELIKSLEQEIKEKFGLPAAVECASLDAVVNKIGLEKSFSDQRIFDLR